MSESPISIAGRSIGPAHPPYVIAELSANHNGDIARAFAIMEAAREAGADAMKLQTYTPDTMTIDCDRPEFHVKGGLWDGNTLFELYGKATTPWEWHPALFAKGRELGLTVFSTPFDETAVDLLEELEAPAYKIASFEAVHLPLIARAARTGKPMIVSTGMADEGEIAEAVQCRAGRRLCATDAAALHQRAIRPSRRRPTCTPSPTCAGASVSRWASPTTRWERPSRPPPSLWVPRQSRSMSRSAGGPDSAFSLEPDELARLVADARDAVANIAEGEVLTSDNVRIIRPGHGLAPKHLPAVLGRRAARTIPHGTPIDWTLIQ